VIKMNEDIIVKKGGNTAFGFNKTKKGRR